MPTSTEIEYLNLIDRHKSIIFRVCQICSCGDAYYMSDLQQEVMLALWQEYSSYGLSRFKQKSQESSWVYRIAMNTSISYLRKVKKNKPMEALDETLLNIVVDERDKNIKEELYDMLSRLEGRDRRLMFHYLEETPYAQIAEMEGMSETAVGTRMSRLFKKMKEIYSKGMKIFLLC